MNSSSTLLFSELLQKLLADAKGFCEAGHDYLLLQCFFHGEPVEQLQPLLKNTDVYVQRAAMFVASELGKNAFPIVSDVHHLLLHTCDRLLRFRAMEVLAVCAVGPYCSYLLEIVFALDSEDDVLRRLAMYLLSRTESAQLRAARSTIEDAFETHSQGLAILSGETPATRDILESLVVNELPLLRRYGAIAVCRHREEVPELMERMRSSNDADLQYLAQRSL